MDALKALALQHDDVYKFVDAVGRMKHLRRSRKSKGAGWRDLARFWYKVRKLKHAD